MFPLRKMGDLLKGDQIVSRHETTVNALHRTRRLFRMAYCPKSTRAIPPIVGRSKWVNARVNAFIFLKQCQRQLNLLDDNQWSR